MDILGIWVGIGQIVVAIIALAWVMFFRSKNQIPVDVRVLGIAIGGLVALPVAGIVAYWLSIVLGTLVLAPGTPAEVFARSTALAAVLGVICGIGWALIFLLPLLKRTATRETGGSGDGENGGSK